MAGKLITIATFENTTEAQVAKNALEAEGIRAVLGDEMTVDLFWNLSNAISGVKVQVLEDDAERALAVLEKELGPDEGGEVDQEQLAAEAEAAPREDEDARTAETNAAPVPAAPKPEAAATPPAEDTVPLPSERDWYARGLFFIAWLGLGFPPVAFVALYFFLNAAFGTGTLSPRGRYNLLVGGLITALGMCFACFLCAGLGGAFR
jgi:hypothetical protein